MPGLPADVAPSTDELGTHGMRMLRPDDTEAVAAAAYEATCRTLEGSEAQAVLRAARSAIAGR